MCLVGGGFKPLQFSRHGVTVPRIDRLMELNSTKRDSMVINCVWRPDNDSFRGLETCCLVPDPCLLVSLSGVGLSCARAANGFHM